MAISLEVFKAGMINAWKLIQPVLTDLLGFVSFLFQMLFGLGSAMLARIFIAGVLIVFLYKLAFKMTDSSVISALIAAIVSILGIRFLPDGIVSALLTPWIALLILSVFVLFTLISKIAWWLRKAIFALLIAIFGFLSYTNPSEWRYFIALAVCLLFLILDNWIHLKIMKLREKSKSAKELDIEIKLKRQRIKDAARAGATHEEIRDLEKELEELMKEKASR